MAKLKITLYSTNSSIRALIRREFHGYQYELVEVTNATGKSAAKANEIRQDTIVKLKLPDNADFVVSTAGLNSKTESLAATLALRQGRRDVYPLILPEALDWLRQALDKRGELVLVGADQA